MVLRAFLALVLLPASWALGQAVPSATAAAPLRTLTVTGAGTTLWPAYHSEVERYAVSTTDATGGTLTVRATTSDPTGKVWIGGVLEPDGQATVTGLEDGDEVPVFIQDAAGRSVHSLVYLPAGFPRLVATTNEPGAAAGHVLLTLNRFSGGGTHVYEAAVDRNGVPVFAHANRDGASQDFKPTGRGTYQVFRDDGSLQGSPPLLELDAAFTPLRSLRTEAPLTRTDAHDAILLADGSRIMAAYEPDPANHHRQDAVIQHIDPDGRVLLTWNSADHMKPVDPTLTGPEREAAMRATDTMNPFQGDTDLTDGQMRLDYAHVNSWELVDDEEGQNLLVSFRNTSSLMKIAWLGARTDGRRPGDVVWRFGGKHSDFTFVDDPDLGPCAQHTGRQLADGNILIYDNGSPAPGSLGDNAQCVDPDDVTGAPVGRAVTRVTEYALDEDAGTATLVRDFRRRDPGQTSDWFAFFAGGVERLANGHDLVAWASANTAIASEVTPGGGVLWELRDARDHGLTPFFSYRATKTVVPDVVAPEMVVEGPADGMRVTQGDRVPVTVRCSDRGGSSLQQCGATTGELLDTSAPGDLTWTAVARDGAGNQVTAQRRYTVVPAPAVVQPPTAAAARPDALVRVGRKRWVGDDVYGQKQQARTGLRRGVKKIRVRVQNDGDARTRVKVRGPGSNREFRVDWYRGKTKVTGKVRRGRLRVGLAPGAQVTLRAVVRRAQARPGAVRTLRVRVVSVGDRSLRDEVRVRVRARGRR